jgi:hypothetical protein
MSTPVVSVVVASRMRVLCAYLREPCKEALFYEVQPGKLLCVAQPGGCDLSVSTTTRCAGGFYR